MIPIFRYSYTTKSTLTRDEFLNHFGTFTWENMSDKEKKAHQYHDCQACLQAPNKSIYTTLTRYSKLSSKADTNHQLQPSPVKAALSNVTNAATATEAQEALHNLNKTVSQVCEEKHGKNAMETARAENPLHKDQVKSVMKKLGTKMTKRWNQALQSNDLGYRGMANVRRDVSLEEKENKSQYAIKPDRFNFNRQLVKDTLISMIEQGKDVNWSDLARRHKVYHPKGHEAKNANEVLKAFAVEEGLVVPSTRQRSRRGKRKIDIDGIEVDLTSLFPTDEALKADTRERIASGEWDIGSPIVPITVQCKRLNSRGKIETRTMTMYGRAYTLQKIMDRTLVTHTQKGFMRKPYPADYNIVDAKQELKKKGLFLFQL